MSKKLAIFIIILIIAIVSIVIRFYMNNDRSKEIVEMGNDEIKIEDLPDPVGMMPYDGNKIIYFENITGKDVEKIIINEYGNNEDQVTATYEFNKEELDVDENNILTTKVLDKDEANYKVTVVIEGIDYITDKTINADIATNESIISFKLDESNGKIILLKEIDEGEYVEL